MLVGKIKEDDKFLNPFMHNYWTHKDLLDLDSDSLSDSGSDSDEKDTDDESERKDSEFMDNMDVEGGGESNMIGNPKRTVQKVSKRAGNTNTSKVTGLNVRSLCFWLVIDIVSYFRVLQALVDLLLRYI